MPVSPPLLSRDVLQAIALLQPVPAVVWVIGADLILEDLAGPLAGFGEPERGKHLYEILGTDTLADPILGAVHQALQGQVTPYTVHRHGHWWQCTVGPLRQAGYLAGVLGIGCLVEQGEESGSEPYRYVVTESDEAVGARPDDRLVVKPERSGGRELLIRYLPSGTTSRLMSFAKLRPFTPADAGSGAPSPAAAPPGRRLVRGRLRIEG